MLPFSPEGGDMCDAHVVGRPETEVGWVCGQCYLPGARTPTKFTDMLVFIYSLAMLVSWLLPNDSSDHMLWADILATTSLRQPIQGVMDEAFRF